MLTVKPKPNSIWPVKANPIGSQNWNPRSDFIFGLLLLKANPNSSFQSIARSKILFGVAPPASSSHLQHQRRTALVSVARPESSSHSQSSLHSQRHLHTPPASLHNWALQTPILTLPEEVKFHLGMLHFFLNDVNYNFICSLSNWVLL